ncbi:MAG: ankyrin repeat domain-containing protein [Rhabdochlamydiaceae bacterium]
MILSREVPYSYKTEKGIQAFSNGGINMLPGDKVAEFDPRAGQIKKEHDQLISDLPPQQVHYVHSEEGLTGILFKMEFESFSLDDQIEQGDTTSCFYAPNPRKPLTEVQFQALLAIVELDKAAFQEAALKIRDWDFQDVFGFSSIHYAADAKDPFFLDVIIRSNAPLTARSVEGYTALHHAVKNGCLANVEMLINVQPSLIDSIDRAHATPLHVAAIENRLDVANTLLLAGANPNCKTAMGMNPLMIAIYQGFENLALLMLDLQNIDLQHQLGDHSTALHLAVAKRMGFVVSFLIKQGCPVERSRQDGYTALHLAAELGWEEGVRLILSMVPYLDHEVKTREGKTAIELAIENHHRGVQEILQSSTRLNSAQPPSVNEPPKDDSYCSIF